VDGDDNVLPREARINGTQAFEVQVKELLNVLKQNTGEVCLIY